MNHQLKRFVTTTALGAAIVGSGVAFAQSTSQQMTNPTAEQQQRQLQANPAPTLPSTTTVVPNGTNNGMNGPGGTNSSGATTMPANRDATIPVRPAGSSSNMNSTTGTTGTTGSGMSDGSTSGNMNNTGANTPTRAPRADRN